MNLEKSVNSTMFQRFKQKHSFVHIQLMFYPRVKFKNFSLSVFRDIAWTRGQLDRGTDGKLQHISLRFTGDNHKFV